MAVWAIQVANVEVMDALRQDRNATLLSVFRDALLAITCCILLHSCCCASEPPALEQLIRRLDHDHFDVRQRAAEELIDSREDDIELEHRLFEILRQGTASTEMQFAIREVLGQRSAHQEEWAIARLRGAVGRLDEVTSKRVTEVIPGWALWQSLLGSGHASRHDFVLLFKRYPDCAARMGGEESRFPAIATLLEARSYESQAASDPAFWSLVLANRLAISESSFTKAARLQLDHRLSMVLSNDPLRGNEGKSQETVRSQTGQQSMTRLIEQWLVRTEHTMPRRTAILIALRAGCRDRAEKISLGVLQHREASPIDLVTAMLVFARQPNPFLSSHFDDTRRAFQWQMLAEQKTVIDTQVRDVAIAIALDQIGTDIRSCGFEFTRADPLLRFRDCSLGFANQNDRDRSLSQALEELGSLR